MQLLSPNGERRHSTHHGVKLCAFKILQVVLHQQISFYWRLYNTASKPELPKEKRLKTSETAYFSEMTESALLWTKWK